jgi:peptide/histidine transporter 3/4
MPDLLDLDTGDVPPRQHSTAATRDLAWSSRRRTLLLTSGLILSSELCERLAYYSLSTNLVGRLASLGFSPGAASSATAAWSGVSYLVALLGAWLADAVIGRYWVIFGGSVLYQLGLAAVVAVTALEAGAAALLGALSVCALGTGAIKASVGSFGADQFDLSSPGADPREARGLARYFNFFYFSINVGALVASTVVVWVQEEVSWVAGYSIPAAAFAVSFALFLAGSRIYVRVPPKRGPFARVGRVLWRSLWSRRKAVVPAEPRELFQSDDEEEAAASEREGGESGAAKRRSAKAGCSSPSSDSDSDPVSHTNYAVWLDRAAVKDAKEEEEEEEQEEEEPKAAKVSSSTPASTPCTLSAVEETKRCLAYLTVCSSLILFWLVYSQMTTAFVLQGNSGFDRRVGKGFEVPSASLSSFNTLAILVLVPAYDSLVVPLVRRLRAKRAAAAAASGEGATVGGGAAWDGSPTHLERIGAGLAVSVLSMLAGAAAEAGRSRAAASGSKRPSVLLLAPQYFLVGAAEVLASVGALDLAFTDSPDSMRSLLSAASLLSVAVGSFAASGVTAAVERGGGARGGGWLPDSERGSPGRLSQYYLMLAGVSAANFLFFVLVVARSYEYKRPAAARRAAGRSPEGGRRRDRGT